MLHQNIQCFLAVRGTESDGSLTFALGPQRNECFFFILDDQNPDITQHVRLDDPRWRW